MTATRTAPLHDGCALHEVAHEPLGADELRRLDAYWRSANYLSVGQIYLMGNPLLREPLLPAQVKHDCSGTGGPPPA